MRLLAFLRAPQRHPPHPTRLGAHRFILQRRRIDVAGNWKYDKRAAAAVVEAAGPRLGSELELFPI